MKAKQLEELVLQSLEHEIGGVAVYTKALTCATNPDLKKEWQRYLAETKRHVEALQKVCKSLGIDPKRETPGRGVVRFLGESLVAAMEKAKAARDSAAAEIVACECVVLAETKDHANWKLLETCAAELADDRAEVLRSAVEEIEDQEDEHFYHSRGWCRELWMQSLGIAAVLPPPEERRKVKTAIGAAKAEQSGERSRL